MSVCRNCSHENEPSAAVCANCNANLALTTPSTLETESEEKPKKGRSNIRLLIGLISLFLCGTCGFLFLNGNLAPDPQTTQSQPRKTTVDVTYRLTGSTRAASITMENETGNTEQFKETTTRNSFDLGPYEKTFTVPVGTFVYISAQNDRDTGSITCEILYDGVVAETATSTGAYVIATCDGTAR